MSKSYLIEIGETPAGILVREGQTYIFTALTGRYNPLDGARFSGPIAAERAARRLNAPQRARHATAADHALSLAV